MSARYLIKRFLYSIITIWAILTLSFILFRLLPGDPASVMIDPLSNMEQREILIERYGLNKPLHLQYVQYLGMLVTGDLGLSYQSRQPVADIVGVAFLNSFVLAFVMFILAYGVGATVGAFLAWRRGTWIDRAGVGLALTLRGAPPFFVGIMLIIFFASELGWLPSSGMRSSGFGSSVLETYFTVDFLKHLILPALTGAIYSGATPVLVMRNTMLDITQADFLDLARAKGLSEYRVLFTHGIRNALLPLLAEGSQFFAFAIGGLVTIEVVFSWPGLGRSIVQAVLFRDYPVAQAAFLYIGLLVVVAYFMSDVLAAVLDPRARRLERAPA